MILVNFCRNIMQRMRKRRLRLKIKGRRKRRLIINTTFNISAPDSKGSIIQERDTLHPVRGGPEFSHNSNNLPTLFGDMVSLLIGTLRCLTQYILLRYISKEEVRSLSNFPMSLLCITILSSLLPRHRVSQTGPIRQHQNR